MSSPQTPKHGSPVFNVLVVFLLALGVVSFTLNRSMSVAAASLFEITILVMLLYHTWTAKVYHLLFGVQVCASLVAIGVIVARWLSGTSGETAFLNPHILVVIVFCIVISRGNVSARKQPGT